MLLSAVRTPRRADRVRQPFEGGFVRIDARREAGPVVGQRNINIPMGSSHIWDRAIPKLVGSRIKSRGQVYRSPSKKRRRCSGFRLIKL
jgi:hypothetical protein